MFPMPLKLTVDLNIDLVDSCNSCCIPKKKHHHRHRIKVDRVKNSEIEKTIENVKKAKEKCSCF